ncbi:hypothetical protein [Paludisphaera rhizosphaerae]|uniref:hypothetical protein n=1 Tax=Paludisphaera rhizosphaerae TaxID=2711216 RepID=UPI0013EDE311|nr:hypothetical protein [Paludisphaera rhizosphaerae]
MALLAESLVEEWLNRNGYFTIRGVKQGLGEMDLLAVRPQAEGVIGWHVEVTVSFRPIGYIAREPAGSPGGKSSYVRKRDSEQIRACARTWIDAKFRSPAKVRLRTELWPGVAWSFHLIHGAVRYTDELEAFAAEGVTCHPFYELLSDLSKPGERSFSGSAGGDLAEIIGYYKSVQAPIG